MANTKRKAASKQSSDTCWSGYKKEGMKKKEGKTVPNCVPEKGSKRKSK